MKRSRFKGSFCDYVRAAKEDGVIRGLLTYTQCYLVEQGNYDSPSEMLNDSDLSNKLKMYLNVVRGEREAIHRILRVSYDPELDPKKGNYKLRREVD